MKTLRFCVFGLVSVFALSIVVHAQEAPETVPQTKLETIEDSVGRVIIRNSSYIGQRAGTNGASVRVVVVELVDALRQSKDYGIEVTVSEPGQQPTARHSYVDYQEIDPMLKALDALVKVDNSQTTLNAFDAHYRTVGGLEIHVFSDRSGARASVSAGSVRQSTADFTLNDFAFVHDLLDAAKKKIDSVKQ